MIHINLLEKKLEAEANHKPKRLYTMSLNMQKITKAKRCALGIIAGLGIMASAASRQDITTYQALPAITTAANHPSEIQTIVSSTENYQNYQEGRKAEADEMPAVLETIEAKKGDYVMVVNKQTQTAKVYRLEFVPVTETTVSTGKNQGNKQVEGDCKTPEGVFKIISSEDSSNWKYEGKYAYGPKFLRLDYELNGASTIGVHGTDEPEKLGIPASHGCVRMNDDVISQYVAQGYLKPGAMVAIIHDNRQLPLARYLAKQPAHAQEISLEFQDPNLAYNNLEGLLNKAMETQKK
jgi:lipoprotein-anchoring transpeptidase ErfK/SrfK